MGNATFHYSDLQLVKIDISGDISKEEFLEGRRRIKEICIQKSADKLLLEIEDSASINCDVIMMSLLDGEFTEDKLPEQISTAIIVSEQKRPNIKLIAVTARNRGRNVKVFSSSKAAYHWLAIPEFGQN